MAQQPLTIFIHAMDATGHLNSCVGFAQALAARRHRVIFLFNGRFKGQYSKYGFEEVLLEAAPPKPIVAESPTESPEEDPIKKRAKALLACGLLNGKSTLEKMKRQVDIADGFGAQLLAVALEFNPQIKAAIEREKPDLFILDHFLLCPAILEAKIPWVSLDSSSPLGLYKSPKLPPPESGYSLKSDPATWIEFRECKNEFARRFRKYPIKLYEAFGYPYTEADLPDPGFCSPKSPFGAVYGYPKELDYDDVAQIDREKYIQIDAFCREEAVNEDPDLELPENFLNRKPGQKLIYFSMGSVAVFDIEMVQRICGFLSKTGHLTVVSKGPLEKEYSLPDGCWGRGNLPQTAILPLVDLVVTHGGNNTVTEAFTFGKPMIVLPVFADQPDNAQRIEEKGFGVRLNPYEVKEEVFIGAVKKLLDDEALKKRLEVAAKRIADEKSKERAVEKLENLVKKWRK